MYVVCTIDLQLYKSLVTFLPFLATFCFTKLPKMAMFCFTNLLQNMAILCFTKLPKMAINVCALLPKMAIKGLICYSKENFSHCFAISGNILNFSNNARQKFLLTSKLPKMANEHSSSITSSSTQAFTH